MMHRPLQLVMFDSLPDASTDGNSDEWYTPDWVTNAARHVMGGIALDPASSTAANAHVKAERYYTIRDNGLIQHWRAASLWFQPPYSDPLPWVKKLEHHYRIGGMSDVQQWIALMPDRVGVEWFNRLITLSSAICFFEERIRFLREDGRKTSSPNFGNIAFYGGGSISRFLATFGKFGHTMTTF